ncbi:MAG: pyrroline-5-carboxylate reductase [Gammaproteobacteria bacterium]|nr:pyrroline-5-carboxylate reductase [Gammaproteobacteria bacterium]
MKECTITFIGGGNMARSLIGGLINNGVSADSIRVADPDPAPLAASLPVQLYTDNLTAVEGADAVVLAVKPQILREVAADLAARLSGVPPLFISIAAGVRVADLLRWLHSEHLTNQIPMVRAMPNTPALVQSGASALFAEENVSKDHRELAERILRAVGLTLWLEEESLLDAVTALSGSGPAYFFLVMEALEKAGTELGLTEDEARILTLQTAFGAAKMALESSENAAVLRARVTSKGGTTEQAVQVLQNGGLEKLFADAARAARDRSISLAEKLGGQ